MCVCVCVCERECVLCVRGVQVGFVCAMILNDGQTDITDNVPVKLL